MPGGYGNEASYGIVAQNSFGTVGSGFSGLPILSETLDHTIEEAREGDFTRYGWLEPPIQPGREAIQGGVEFEPYPEVLGHVLKGFFGISSGQSVDDAERYDFYTGGNVGDWDTYAALPPYTIYAFRGVGSGMLYADCQITELTLSQEPGGFLKGSMAVIGRGVTVEDPHTVTWEGNKPWLWDQASVSWEGAGMTTLESFELSMSNKVEGVDTLNLSRNWGQSKRTDFFEATLNGTMQFDNIDEYLKFANNSYFAIGIYYEQPTAIASGYYDSLYIDIPNFRYTTFPPQVSGPGRINVSFTGRAIADATSLYSVQISLVNTHTGGY